MNIRLPIENVDSLVDIALSIRTDISYQRKVYKTPPRITYAVRFTNLATAPWKIQIYPMGDSSEITFPVHIREPSHIVQYPSGSSIEIFEEDPFEKLGKPIYADPIDKAIYDICNSIYHKVKSQEDNSSNDSSKTQSSIVDFNPDAGQGEELPPEEEAAVELRKKAKQLGISVKRLKRWNELIYYKEKLYLNIGQMAEREDREERTIQLDFHDMKEKGFYT